MMPMTLTDSDIQFMAARVRRLCKAFHYPIPDERDDEFIVGVAGSLIGGLLAHVECEKPIGWACWPEGMRASGATPSLWNSEPGDFPDRIPLMEKPPAPVKFHPPAKGD